MSLGNAPLVFIGGGVMGEAMIRRLVEGATVAPSQIAVIEPLEERRAALVDRYAVQVRSEIDDALSSAQIVVLAVKPQVMGAVLEALQSRVHPEALIFSIAAGIPIARITQALGEQQPVVRVMPNTPAQIGAGMSVWTCTSSVRPDQREQALVLLRAMGEEVFVEDEHYLDMATALNGSGPAYVFLFMEALVDAGVHLGLPRPVVERLVLQTVKGSVEYALSSRLHLAQLRNQVTSPGGTTAAALHAFEEGQLRAVVARAVWAAYRRSVELGQGH